MEILGDLTQKELFKYVFVATDSKEFCIVREIFIEERNTGWIYETLVSGFKSQLDAELYIINIFKGGGLIMKVYEKIYEIEEWKYEGIQTMKDYVLPKVYSVRKIVLDLLDY